MTNEEELRAIQARLLKIAATFRADAPATFRADALTKAADALTKAADWIGDVINPLNDAEQERWAQVADGVCSDAARDMDAWLFDETLTDADRRNWLEQLGEDEA